MQALNPEPAMPWLEERSQYYRQHHKGQPGALRFTLYTKLTLLCKATAVLTSRQRITVDQMIERFGQEKEADQFALILATYINSCG